MYINISLAINNSTTASRRGELNGIAMTVGSLSKAAGPAIYAAVFAASINSSHGFPVDFHLVYFLMTFGLVVLAVMGWNSVNIDFRKLGSMTENRSTDGDVDSAEDGETYFGYAADRFETSEVPDWVWLKRETAYLAQ